MIDNAKTCAVALQEQSCLRYESLWTERETQLEKVANIIRVYFGRHDELILEARLDEHKELCDKCSLIDRGFIKEGQIGAACGRRAELEAALEGMK